ncbi:MATE family efflux transporter [Pseudoalteromonas sp. GCY]|uniref:MATE family efflux transporter n=1 Tax=Pseudoalteromonas sp. GCY TaxID=2003316 RepID=UPI000BFEBA3B|nr:MATE family efflux transporter [Pseudoalteromonas sp. GCY]PHI37664.1 MATE family efflux transporter [Pseudoalteromonas sp. GCY]QQQ68738.1 MATE family efflux transporter [Pseudoalteromonas sp. GCY]
MNFSTWEARRLLQLAIPVFLAQVTLVLMTVVDTMMAGQVSAEDLAALSIATGVWNPLIFSLQGILLALTSIVAHCHGANDTAGIKRFFQQSLYLALALFTVGLVLANFTSMVFSNIGASENVQTLAQGYIDFVKWGLLGFLIFTVYRNVTEGVGQTKPAFYISIVGLCINVVANYIFIYGKFGAPALGSAGCGLATSIVLWSMAIAQWVYSLKSKYIDGKALISGFTKPSLSMMKYVAALGFPIALATFFEVTLFACIPLFIADLGPISVSGHQIAASVTTMLFMMPLSLSMAIAIRIGNLTGQGALDQLKLSVNTAFLLATLIALFVALITYIGRDQIVWLYTNNTEVAALATSIMVLACLYQLPDALQVSANGVLRGLKYTKPISWVTFVSYWLIGFSLGYVLAKTDLITPAMGPQGFWIGIIIGLSTAAVLLVTCVNKRVKFEISQANS